MVWLLSLQLLLESLLSQSRWPILANICWTISQSDWSHLGLCCCKEIFWDTRWGTLTHKCNLSTTWAPLLPIYLSFVGGEWEHSGSLNVTERWEAPGDPYCGKGSLTVCSAVHVALAGSSGVCETWAFCRKGPAERTAEVRLQDQRASLLRLRFQSTDFYYILMIRVTFYSWNSNCAPLHLAKHKVSILHSG